MDGDGAAGAPRPDVTAQKDELGQIEDLADAAAYRRLREELTQLIFQVADRTYQALADRTYQTLEDRMEALRAELSGLVIQESGCGLKRHVQLLQSVNSLEESLANSDRKRVVAFMPIPEVDEPSIDPEEWDALKRRMDAFEAVAQASCKSLLDCESTQVLIQERLEQQRERLDELTAILPQPVSKTPPHRALSNLSSPVLFGRGCRCDEGGDKAMLSADLREQRPHGGERSPQPPQSSRVWTRPNSSLASQRSAGAGHPRFRPSASDPAR